MIAMNMGVTKLQACSLTLPSLVCKPAKSPLPGLVKLIDHSKHDWQMNAVRVGFAALSVASYDELLNLEKIRKTESERSV